MSRTLLNRRGLTPLSWTHLKRPIRAVEMFHDEEGKELMNQCEITSEVKTVFRFQEHKYDRLEDAVSYAKKLHVIENDN